ncbi:ABC transporter permease [Streptomyces beijiangensis]|uniref:ABC transporter permease n=1 Tax=Streptomyces beijiangensis TaxID=163361 RepID=A0A939JI56_9ACTN|nr:ABC transporter permease [Streptomyces beijiangensis]MBO0512825.1 ABC transporter permease [Streptomyces beijiangensis]
MPAPAVAPWVRTRLRTAPGAATALAVLVLLTSCLAAAFPRGVDTYEDRGLRHAISEVAASQAVIEVSTLGPDITLRPDERAGLVRPRAVAKVYQQLLQQIPGPLRIDNPQASYGYRTIKPLETGDPWLAMPDGVPPQVTVAAQSDLARHARVVQGRLPTAKGPVSEDSAEGEAAVTRATAKTLHIKLGSVIHSPNGMGGQLSFRITGIVEPVRPQDSYWSVQPILRTPSLTPIPSPDPKPSRYWIAGLLLAPEAAPLLASLPENAELYWNLPPNPSGVTSHELSQLTTLIASLESGPRLEKMKTVAGDSTEVRTGLDDVFARYKKIRDSISPVVAVAAFGTGTVAMIVLLMAGGLAAARRQSELALLRSRGASMRGLGGRLAAETAVVVLPAAALGFGAALLAVPEGRTGPAVAGAVAVAAVAALALPVRALAEHRRPQVNGDRQDVVRTRPSRRRTVAELTLVVLAVGAVVALRRRGTAAGADQLVSAAPVLVGIIASLILIRLYPLPLRWAARPAARLRTAVGFLSLARAGRSSAGGVLPLLALLTALTTAAFGGSVLAGVADARDRAAMLDIGADARISSLDPLPARLAGQVSELPGVDAVTAVDVEYDVALPDQGARIPVLGVDPSSYAALARHTGFGPFPAGQLAHRGGASAPLPALATPAVAKRFGTGPLNIKVAGYDRTVRIVAVRDRTPGLPDQDFLVVDNAGLGKPPPTALMITGSPAGKALRAATHGLSASVQLRAEERRALVDSPMQTGAERMYTLAVLAGAGFAALALLLALLRAAPERAALLARLRTMGLTRRQARGLLVLEALPQALPAAVGGALTGWAAIRLLSSGMNLDGLALAGGSLVPDGGVQLQPDPWSLALPALCVVALATAVAALQAWWSGRRGSITELRAGDAR